MPASRAPNRGDWAVNIVLVAAAAGALVLIGATLGTTHPLVFVGAALAVLFFLVRWHARNSAYLCASRGGEFVLTPLQDFFSPHSLTTKYARCPHCGEHNWSQLRVRE